MPRTIWKENHVISIETRRGLYTLAQMSCDPFLIFFQIFRTHDTWDDGVDLNKIPVLFCKAVTRQFLKHSVTAKQPKVLPLNPAPLPTRWIHSAGFGARQLTAWAGTSDERRYAAIGEGGILVEKDVYNHKGGPYRHPSGVYDSIIKTLTSSRDTATIEQYECDTLAVFPATNERLYQCHLAGKNVDPDKRILFDQPLPKDYAIYIDISGGQDETRRHEARKLFRI